MKSTERIRFAIESEPSFEFLRELELRKFLSSDSCVDDIIKLYAHKLTKVEGKKNATLTIVQDLTWELLTALWNRDYLLPKQQLFDRLRTSGDVRPKTTANSREIYTPTAKDLELKNALDTVLSLRSQLTASSSELADAKAFIRRISIDRCDMGSQAEIFVPDRSQHNLEHVLIEAVIDADAHSAILTRAIRESGERVSDLGTNKNPDGLEGDLFRISETTETATRKRSESGNGVVVERRGVETYQPEGTEELNARGIESVSVHRSGSSNARLSLLYHRGSLESPKQVTDKELELMRQREVEDELRINELMSELIEKDEIIQKVLEMVRNMSSRSRLSSAVPSGRMSAPILFEEMSASVSAFLEEKSMEITELRLQNETFRRMMDQRQSENEFLSKKMEVMNTVEVRKSIITATSMTTDQGSQISQRGPSSYRANLTDNPSQTMEYTVLLTTRPCPITMIESDGFSSSETEDRLIQSLEEERQKSKLAIEETKRVKFCLNELEKQLAALQFQLRRSGVRQDHIQSALMKSGLTTLMRASRAAVFERLYQDALDRVSRMEKIRQEVLEMQSKHLLRRFSPDAGDRPAYEHLHPSNIRVQILGGGFLAENHSELRGSRVKRPFGQENSS